MIEYLLDPEIAPALALLRPVPIDPAALPEFRSALANRMAALPPQRVEGISVGDDVIPGPPGAPALRVRISRPTAPAARPRPALLHIHGGGYMIGAPDHADLRNGADARALDTVVVSVDYRLAPEAPYPAAIEDCHAALVWLHGSAATLGVDPTRIAVSGESAGGGLAAALALLARDRGTVPIAFQCLTYPMIDDRTLEERLPLGALVWTAAQNRAGWQALLGHAPGGSATPAYAAAARASDLAGLPPAFIAVGALDLFLAEDLAYAAALAHAGVPVETHVYPGCVHGFDMAAEAAVSKRFTRDRRAALMRVFGQLPA